MKAVIHVYPKSVTEVNNSDKFNSINDALSGSHLKNADMIEMHLHNGIHSDDIVVDKPLSIIGETPKEKNVVLKASIKNPKGKSLEIRNITLDISDGHCISQIGGNISIKNVTIKNLSTNRPSLNSFKIIPQIIISTTGSVCFEGSHITADDNKSTVFYIAGENTKAILSNVTITGHRLENNSSSTPPNPCGAIEVADKATLCIEKSSINHNEYIGINVQGGSKMHLRETSVRGTKSVQGCIGINLKIQESIVELRNFECDQAEGIGIYFDDAYITAQNGTVNNNNTGIFIKHLPNDPTYNLDCCLRNVEFVGNVGKVVGTAPLPCPPDGFGPLYACKNVPWG